MRNYASPRNRSMQYSLWPLLPNACPLRARENDTGELLNPERANQSGKTRFTGRQTKSSPILPAKIPFYVFGSFSFQFSGTRKREREMRVKRSCCGRGSRRGRMGEGRQGSPGGLAKLRGCSPDCGRPARPPARPPRRSAAPPGLPPASAAAPPAPPAKARGLRDAWRRRRRPRSRALRQRPRLRPPGGRTPAPLTSCV